MYHFGQYAKDTTTQRFNLTSAVARPTTKQPSTLLRLAMLLVSLLGIFLMHTLVIGADTTGHGESVAAHSAHYEQDSRGPMATNAGSDSVQGGGSCVSSGCGDHGLMALLGMCVAVLAIVAAAAVAVMLRRNRRFLTGQRVRVRWASFLRQVASVPVMRIRLVALGVNRN